MVITHVLKDDYGKTQYVIIKDEKKRWVCNRAELVKLVKDKVIFENVEVTLDLRIKIKTGYYGLYNKLCIRNVSRDMRKSNSYLSERAM